MLDLVLFIGLILIALSIYRYKKVFNPFSLESYFTIFFMIIPQVIMIKISSNATMFFWSDVVMLVYLLSMFAGTLLNIKTYRFKGIENVRVINTINGLFYALLIIPILPLLISFGLSTSGFRAFYENVVFSKFAVFYELSKLVLYFLIFFKLIHHQRFTWGFFLLFPLVFFYGSRFVILDFLIYVCVFLEQYRSFGLKRILVVCLIGAASIGAYSASQFNRTKVEVLFTSYFDIYKNQSYVINRLLEGKSEYYYGEIYFSSFLKYIPRIIWPEKPRAFGFAILNYEFLPEEAASGYMPGFGLGSAFADFGFFSIIAFGFFAGFVRNYLYHMFLKSRNNLTFFLYVFPFSLMTCLFLGLYLLLDSVIARIKDSRSINNEYEPS